MLAPKGKLILVMVAGAVVAAGLGASYLLYFGPKQERSDAVSEVRALEPRWRAVRDCLRGSVATGGDLGEQLLLSEMTEKGALDNLRRCRFFLDAAERESAFRTGDEEFEQAWTNYRARRSALAKAIAHRTARRSTRRRRLGRIRNQLAKSANEIEDTYQALRSYVGLESDVEPFVPLPTLEVRPLSESLASPTVGRLEVANNRALAIDIASEPRRLFVWRDGVEEITALRRGVSVAASPPPGWGVTDDERGIAMADLETDNDVGAGGRVITGRLGSGDWIAGGLGSASERVVVVASPENGAITAYNTNSLSATIRSKSFPMTPGGNPTGDLDLLFRRLIVQDNSQTLEWTEHNVALPMVYPFRGVPCYAESASWWQAGPQLIRSAEGAAEAIAQSHDMPWQERACTDEQVLGAWQSISKQDIVVRLCSRVGCAVATSIPLAAESSLFVLIAPRRGPILVTSFGTLVTVWQLDQSRKARDGRTEFVPQTSVRQLGVVGVVEWKGQLGLVVRSGEAAAIAVLK